MPDWRYDFRPDDDSRDEKRLKRWRKEGLNLQPPTSAPVVVWIAACLVAAVVIAVIWASC